MKIKKIAALLTALSMIFLTACTAKNNSEPETTEPTTVKQEAYVQQYYAKPAAEVLKTETVYVNLKSDGSVSDINVSDWLHTDSAGVYVDDISDLKNVTNVKSKVQPVKTENGMRWHMPETDLYYSGKTEKPLPVEIQLKYYLDGKELSADEIAGKSGKVKIEIKMLNKAYKEGLVNGKKHKVYLPMIVVGGMILPEGKFSSVSVENGQSIGDGSKEIIVFTGMPGFSESLGLADKELGEIGGLIIGDSASVTAQTDNFSLTNMYFAALPIASLNLDFAIPETVDELKTMLASLKSFQNALNKIDPERVIYTLLSDKSKVQSLIGVLNDTLKIYNKNKNLLDMLAKYATVENAETIKSLLESLNDPDVKEALELLANPAVKGLLTKLPGIMSQFENVSPLLSALQKDMENEAIRKEIAALPETIGYLNNISKVISDNSEELGALLDILGDDGTAVLKSLLENIDTADLTHIADKYGDLVQDGDVLVRLAEEWLNFGRSYGLYTKSTENMKTSLAFIMNTPTIEKIVEPASAQAKEETLPWYKKLFS